MYEQKKRISSIHWTYYDQKILDDRYDKAQGRKRARPHKIRQSLIPIRAYTFPSTLDQNKRVTSGSLSHTFCFVHHAHARPPHSNHCLRLHRPAQTAPPKATQTLNGATTSSKTQKNPAYHHQDSPSTPLSLANLIRAARVRGDRVRLGVTHGIPGPFYRLPVALIVIGSTTLTGAPKLSCRFPLLIIF